MNYRLDQHIMECLGRILYVDAYDSFANNVVGLLENQLNVEVTLVRIDNVDVARNLNTFLAYFDAVVVGPGPGHPAIPKDVGFISQLWSLTEENILPVFSICLGFQSLSMAFGADVRRMKSPRHGIVSDVIHAKTDIFDGVDIFEATRYHSLCVDIGHPMQNEPSDAVRPWVCSPTCPALQPLAWVSCDGVNGTVLMSVKHKEKPFWGVQFHPESICTTLEGQKVIRKWWSGAQAWSATRGRFRAATLSGLVPSTSQMEINGKTTAPEPLIKLDAILQTHLPNRDGKLLWADHPLGATTVVGICEAMGLTEGEVTLLDSQGHGKGRYSIIGLIRHGKTLKITYTVQDKRLLVNIVRGEQVYDLRLESIDQIWPVLQKTLDRHAPQDDHVPHESPFWGGWVGLISYEAGLETLSVDAPPPRDHYSPDLNFAFIERSIVIDLQEKRVYLQSLIPQDDMWLFEAGKLIDSLSGKQRHKAFAYRNHDVKYKYQMLGGSDSEEKLFKEAMKQSYIERPNREAYCKRVLKCQESLSAGDSYELCLTDETQICIPRTKDVRVSPWTVYKKLRKNNPATFGCYILLSNTTVVGSSPERFLRWTRDGQCQFRPIKGTVKKAPGVNFAEASTILSTSKERAENLMIVDLIRHDLSGVIGAQSCNVPKLMQVEEYETVFQLVSVIEGQIPDDIPNENSTNRTTQASAKTSPLKGIDVLKASLPPGSMTGAPKKRSCEILVGLERRPRGIYSGVIGYMDVGGGGDFSVVIRTATKVDNDFAMRPAKHPPPHSNGNGVNDTNGVDDHYGDSIVPHEIWRIGAGGAVTIQSTDIDEFIEMETKLDSVLSAFRV